MSNKGLVIKQNIQNIANAIKSKGGALLPEEYTRVEYIESDGSGQYIYVNYIPTNDTGIRIQTSFSVLDGDIPRLGTKNLNITDSRFFIGTIGKSIYFGYNTYSTGSGRYPATEDIEYDISMNFKNNGWCTVNSKQLWDISNTTLVTQNRSIILFQYQGDNTYKSKYKIYLFQASEGDTLVRDMVPCIRKSDNRPGLYDLVNNVFYINQGTGEFTYGNPVSTLKVREMAQAINRLPSIQAVSNLNVVNTTQESTALTITDAKEAQINRIDVSGKTEQKTRGGKNILNNARTTYDYSNVDASHNTVTSLPTGIRYSTTYSGGVPFILFKSIDLTNYAGKTIRMKATYTGDGRYRLGLCNSDASSRTILASSSASDEIILFTVPSSLGNDKYLYYQFIVNDGNNTIDFTDAIVTVDNSDMSYEPYGVMPSPDYPSPIENVGGMNVLENNITTQTVNGVTFTKNSDGSVRAVGTASGNANCYLTYALHNKLTQGQYYTSSIGQTMTSNIRILVEEADSLGWKRTIQNQNNPTWLWDGFKNGGDRVRVCFSIISGTTVDTILYPMVVKGSYTPETMPPYVPYNTINFSVEGFNLWDEEWENGYYDKTTGEKISSIYYVRSKNFIKVKPSSVLYLPYMAMCKYGISGSVAFNMFYYDNNKNFISTFGTYTNWTVDRWIVTLPNNCHYINFYVNGYGTIYNNDLCINYSDPDVNGQYEPYYTPQTVAFPLGEKVLMKGSKLTDYGFYDERTQIVTNIISDNIYTMPNGNKGIALNIQNKVFESNKYLLCSKAILIKIETTQKIVCMKIQQMQCLLEIQKIQSKH